MPTPLTTENSQVLGPRNELLLVNNELYLEQILLATEVPFGSKDIPVPCFVDSSILFSPGIYCKNQKNEYVGYRYTFLNTFLHNLNPNANNTRETVQTYFKEFYSGLFDIFAKTNLILGDAVEEEIKKGIKHKGYALKHRQDNIQTIQDSKKQVMFRKHNSRNHQKKKHMDKYSEKRYYREFDHINVRNVKNNQAFLDGLDFTGKDFLRNVCELNKIKISSIHEIKNNNHELYSALETYFEKVYDFILEEEQKQGKKSKKGLDHKIIAEAVIYSIITKQRVHILTGDGHFYKLFNMLTMNNSRISQTDLIKYIQGNICDVVLYEKKSLYDKTTSGLNFPDMVPKRFMFNSGNLNGLRTKPYYSRKNSNILYTQIQNQEIWSFI